MKQRIVGTARSNSSSRRFATVVRLVSVFAALSVAAACSEAPSAPTAVPTPDVQATAPAMVQATAGAKSTPAPKPTPNVLATAQAMTRAAGGAEPTPTATRVPAPTAIPTATARPAPTLPPVFPVDPASVAPPRAGLHDRQEIRVPNGHGGIAPWRDGGGQRIYSTWVYGTIYQIDKSGAIRPYIGTSHTVNEDETVWTVKLRDDAVFQDGTPITAADIKAYWEHGAKPENSVAWGGASLSLGDIAGWEELRYGDAAEAEGLVVIDDHTLEITTAIPFPTWPLAMASWHSGISKLEQVLSEEEWFTRPIGAGPYRWTTDPDTKQFVAEADVAEFWGPSPNIKKLHGLNISDNQVKVIMFENGEVDLMSIDSATYAAALDPSHPFNPLLKVTPYGGVWFIKNKIDMAPLEDLLVRKALAHGADMRSIVKAVWGPAEDFATGIISPLIPCHNPYAPGHIYDPELGRQELSTSSYGNADNLPPLLIDLARPLMIDMGVAMKEYWKDNLGIDLDVQKRESGMPRREASQFYRISVGSWIPDPVQIVSNLTYREPLPGLHHHGHRTLDWLVEHARSLPLDDPERCAAFHAVEEEIMDKVYFMPIRWVSGVRWVVQPWVVGFESTTNLDINTLPWMYIQQH